MASSCKDVCTLCEDDNVSSQAVTWCTECEVFLCMDCDKHHKKSRSSKYHKTMRIEDYHKLPAVMQDISSQCQEHDKKFELYCSFHACPCCVQCVTKHQKCQEIKPLSDILTQVRFSAPVQLLEKDLKVLKENFDVILKYLKTMIDKNNIQKTKVIEKIGTIRKSLDDYLNKLEKQILGDLESKHSKLESNMSALVKQIERQSIKIHKLQDDYIKMRQYATDLQMYVGLREIEKKTSEAAKYIEDLESDGNLKEKKIEIKHLSDLQSLLQNVKFFGDIDITTSPSTVGIKAGRKDQAQDLVQTNPGIKQTKLPLLKTVTMPEKIGPLSINVCRLLPDGKISILDHMQKRLLLFSKDGIFIRIVITFKSYPYDICIVGRNTAAISFGTLKKSELIDIEKNKILKTIELSQNCNGVTSDGKTLVISTYGSLDENCTIVNLKDISHEILKGVEGSCISLFKENMYCTIWNKHNVRCYKRTGKPLWTFINKDIKYPYGIALDIDGFVYVASYGTNKIVVVTPDGKKCKTLLSEADGIIRPVGIDINRDRGIMIVVCGFGGGRQNILIFKI
ncbi:unnamed protein product [Mytilus coruscus]|uniref:B box-type domain-containing protein n=1 Tax=Mytilus coruscus TaxID=42192 RepID=A0A6J8AR64_MYTCO|nr:unnamed protein product [Mytilus coruscus]